jgi:hypothetical protein
MTFKPGNPGKPKGAVHGFTQKAKEVAARLGIDPFEILLRFAAGDWKALGYKSEKYSKKSTRFIISPETRAKAAQEATQYIVPKLRQIEEAKPNALVGMTPEQRLEAMKHAVTMLEAQTKKADNG